MAPTLPLTPDELLTTTRTVRKRLDLERPVEREVLAECLSIALQAPSGSNAQDWHFIVVTDPAKRKALGELYRRGWAIYKDLPMSAGNLRHADPDLDASQRRVGDSAAYLAEIIDQVPVHLIPCLRGRVEGQPSIIQSAFWGSIAPATWNFMLAARARGLGTAWTSLHLFFEEEAANILGVPYAEITQAALIPVAYTIGTEFKPALRQPLETVLHWDQW